MKYIVKLEDGVWLATWDSDPGRTTVESAAKRFDTHYRAQLALRDARQFRPFADAKIVEVAA